MAIWIWNRTGVKEKEAWILNLATGWMVMPLIELGVGCGDDRFWGGK